MSPEEAIAALRAQAEPGRAAEMAAYHKTGREVIGLGLPAVTLMTRDWRRSLRLDQRVALADGLWQSGIFEARIAAAKLYEQARIRPDGAVWAMIASWVPEFDGWAIADHVSKSGGKRLVADPARLDAVEEWTRSDHLWSRRAALVMTLPWAILNHPKPAEIAARERILGWAAAYVPDGAWFIQKSISWWLRALGAHDPARVRIFMAEHGAQMKGFARKDATRNLPPE